MLNKSKKFGTPLTIGPRLKRLIKKGYSNILWEEDYPEQESPTADGRGEFQRTREWIESAPLESVFDLWLRGKNIVGYAETMLEAAKDFTKACSATASTPDANSKK